MTARSSSEPPGGPRLRRELGVFSATFMVVGGIIGSGIFFTPAEVALALPEGPWILAVWALGGVVALSGALTYAELGAMNPEAGGAYVYIRDAFGPLAAFLCGWMTLLAVSTGALAAVAIGFARYAGRFFDLTPAGGDLGLAALTIVVLASVNYLGIRPGAAVQNLLTAVKIFALGGLVVAGAIRWASALPPSVSAPEPHSSMVAALAAAFVPVLFTIGGWQQLNMVAGEIREPQRSIPRALGAGIGIVVAIYLGVNAVYLRFLGRDGLAASSAAAADTATALFGEFGAHAVSVAAMLSILGFVNVLLMGNPRIPYAMARDGLFFRSVGSVHRRFGTPHVAIVVTALWALALLFATRGNLSALLSGVVFADWIFFGLGGASLFVLRRKYPDRPRPYRVPGYPVVPALFVLAALAGVASAWVAAPATSLSGTVLLAAGAFAYRTIRRAPPPSNA